MNRVGVALAAAWPGLPQILWGSILPGTALAVAFAGALDVAIGTTWLAWDVLSMPPAVWWALAATVWAASAGWTAWMVTRGNAARHRRQVNQLLVQAQRHQLRGELDEAGRLLERALRLCPDDCEVMVYLAGICQRQGRDEEAQRLWRRCRVHDWRDKWAWEANTALAHWSRSSETASPTAGASGAAD